MYAVGDQVWIDENARADDSAHHGHRCAKQAKLPRKSRTLLCWLARRFSHGYEIWPVVIERWGISSKRRRDWRVLYHCGPRRPNGRIQSARATSRDSCGERISSKSWEGLLYAGETTCNGTLPATEWKEYHRFLVSRLVLDGWVMSVVIPKFFRIILVVSLSCGFSFPTKVWAGAPVPSRGGQAPSSSSTVTAGQAVLEDVDKQGGIDVFVKGPNGSPIDGSAVVTLSRLNGEFVDQKSAKNGYVRFNEVHATEYKIQVLAPKYEATVKQLEVQERSLAKITIEMTPLSDAEDAAAAAGFYALSPKVQRDVGKALEELRTNKPNDARKHLEAAQKAAPKSAEIEYLFGV
jgi:hypothetical protein